MDGFKIAFGLLACVLLASALEDQVDGDNYIVGGRPARRQQIPFIASLRTTQNGHFCGGFILSDRWVGSAAFCTQGSNSNPQNVIVATAALTRTDGQRHRVSHIINHPRFDSKRLTFNICILRTVSQISISPESASVIRFPAGPVEQFNAIVFAAGWGWTRNPRGPGQGIAHVLQWKATRTITRQQCQESLGTIRASMAHEYSICTLSENRQGICHGDNGGPLFTRDGTCIGIISWAVDCSGSLPSVYTDFWRAIPFFREASENTIPGLPADQPQTKFFN